MDIRNVRYEDLQRLIEIEHASFSLEEAATPQAFKRRIETIADSFFVATIDEVVVGFVNGPVMNVPYITDDLFTTTAKNPMVGGYQSILGLAVDPAFRKQRIGERLLTYLEHSATLKQRETVSLTCLATLITYYERLGYKNEGLSESIHGGEQWFNLVKYL